MGTLARNGLREKSRMFNTEAEKRVLFKST